MSKPWETVVAISDLENRRTLTKILGQFGLDAMCVSTIGQCRELLDKGEVGLLFCGQFFPDGDYRAIVTASCHLNEGPSVILAAVRTPAIADEAIRLGAFDVVGLPFRPTDVEWSVIKAQRNQQAIAAAHAAHRLLAPTRQLENLARHAG
jgi:DNA-binding NtrC family response regulator